jgi:hypothetical protein
MLVYQHDQCPGVVAILDSLHNKVCKGPFSNISAISWRPVVVVEEARAPGENDRPWASNW